MKFNIKNIFLIFFLQLLIGCVKEQTISRNIEMDPIIEIETVVKNYEIIWGMDFFPNGDLIFGEKRGKLYIKYSNSDKITEIDGLPSIDPSGQGGLLDIKVDPSYKKNSWIYMTYTSANPYYCLKFSRFKILNAKLTELQNIITISGNGGHNGSRILFDTKGYIYLSVGEGPSTGGGLSASNKNASDPTSLWGKVHRFNLDGTIPNTNPKFEGNSNYSSIYSIGHRNPQGLALNPISGEIWESEHGPLGGDEINIIRPKGNYGWPAISLGKNYDGSIISQNHDSLGIEKPIYSWTPSIGSCGITFITGEKFKSWTNHLIVSGLASQKLHRCIVNNNKIVSEEIILKDSGRVRNVIQGPDQSLYVSLENPGRIIKMIPR